MDANSFYQFLITFNFAFLFKKIPSHKSVICLWLRHTVIWQLCAEKSKTPSQFLDIWCMFVTQTTFHLEDCSKNKSLFVNPIYIKWHLLKQTKTKIGHLFRRLTFKVVQLCCLVQKDLLTPKVLQLHFVSVKHDSAPISNIECATYHIKTEPCLTETKCNFRTFRVDESFWTKQQSCIS